MPSKYVADMLEDANKRLEADCTERVPEIPDRLQTYLNIWVIPVIEDVIAYERGEMSITDFKYRNW